MNNITIILTNLTINLLERWRDREEVVCTLLRFKRDT